MRRALPTVALALGLLACAGPTVQVRAGGGGPVEARALAVYPYLFGWEEPSFRSLLKASDAVAQAARLPLAVVPPTEFEVTKPAEPNVLAGSTAAKAVAARGLPPRAFLALRSWAVRVGARTVAEATAAGRSASSLVDESAVVAHVEISDAATGEVLVEAFGRTATGDTGASGDPFPELTALHRRLVTAALGALASRLPGGAAGGGAALAPATFETFALPGKSSLADLATRDPIAAAAARREIAAYLVEQRER